MARKDEPNKGNGTEQHGPRRRRRQSGGWKKTRRKYATERRGSRRSNDGTRTKRAKKETDSEGRNTKNDHHNNDFQKKIKDRHYSRGRSRPIMAKTAGGERRSVRRARAVLGGRPLSRKRRRPTDHCIVIRSLRPDFHRRFLRLNFIGARKPKKTNKKPIAIKACRGEEGNRRLLGTGASVRHRRCLCSIKLLALFAVFVCVYLGKRI